MSEPNDAEASTDDAIRRLVAERRAALQGSEAAIAPSAPLYGLALSGGGIRSATFCLGLLRALAANRLLLRFDLMSTVSGGGFIGATIGSLFHRAAAAATAPPPQPQPQPQADSEREAPAPGAAALPPAADPVALQRAIGDAPSRPFGRWLRRNGRYLVPRGVADIGEAAAAMLRNLVGIHFELALLGILAGCLLALLNLVVWGALDVAVIGQCAGGADCASALQWAARASALRSSVMLLAPLFGGLFLVAACAYWATGPGRRPQQLRRQLAWFAFWLLLLLLLWRSDADPVQVATTVGADGTRVARLVAALIAALWVAAFPLLWAFSRFGARDAAVVRLRLTRFGASMLKGLAWTLCLALLDRTAWWLADIDMAGVTAAGLILLAAILRAVLPQLGRLSGGRGWLASRGLLLANLLGLALAFLLTACWVSLVYRPVFAGLFAPGATLAYGDAFARLLLIAALPLLYVLATGRHLDFLNVSSLHPFYRARLVRSYLGATNGQREAMASGTGVVGVGDVDVDDDVPMRDYAPQRAGGPVHLVNACVNESAARDRQQFNPDRRGRLLTVGPGALLRVSGEPAWSRCDDDSRRCDDLLSLGTWTAISGAAFSTGLGSMTRSGLSTLAMFAGVRLGYWWRRDAQRRWGCDWYRKTASVLDETLGQFAVSPGRPWYLSDGGHFENTGAYALLRERCRVIVLADCGADPNYRFDDLENLVRKARIDLRTEIEFVAPAADAPARVRSTFGSLSDLDAPDSQTCLAIARITYPPGDGGNRLADVGWLVIVKPNMFAGAPVDLENFKREHPEFPQQTTVDQFFDEGQWESYHLLGEAIGARLDAQVLRQLDARGDAWFPLPDRSPTLPFEDDAPSQSARTRLSARVEKQIKALGVGTTLGFGAVLAAIGVPLWQAIDSVRTSYATDDRARRETLKEISEKFGKLPPPVPVQAGTGAVTAAAAPAATLPLAELAAALTRMHDILCQKDEGDGEWFRRSSSAKAALAEATQRCGGLGPDELMPSCKALLQALPDSCLRETSPQRLQMPCPRRYWGRDYEELLRLRDAAAVQGAAPQPRLQAEAAPREASRRCDRPLAADDFSREFVAQIRQARPSIADALPGGALAWWSHPRLASAPASAPAATAAPEPASLPAPNAAAPGTASAVASAVASAGADRDLALVRAAPPPPAVPPPPGSVAQAPAGDLQSDVRSDVRSAVRSVVPGNPPPPPADPKACNGYTVLMQIYGAQPRPVVDEFRAAWLDEKRAPLQVDVPAVEDVYASADRAARSRPKPHSVTTLLFNADEQALAARCAEALIERLRDGDLLAPGEAKTWHAEAFPPVIKGARRTIELWYRPYRPLLVERGGLAAVPGQHLLNAQLGLRGFEATEETQPAARPAPALVDPAGDPTLGAQRGRVELCAALGDLRRQFGNIGGLVVARRADAAANTSNARLAHPQWAWPMTVWVDPDPKSAAAPISGCP